MRHNKKFNHLSRKKGHRDAMLANMTISLIMHKRIVTTLAKAKALRVYAEPIITRAKTDDTPSRRLVFKKLQNKQAVTELFGEIAQKVGDRPGGYTRILKLGNRKDDNAKVCFIELVDFNESYTASKKATGGESTARKATRRSRRKGKAADAVAPAAEAPAAAPQAEVEAAPAAEAPASEAPAPEAPAKEEEEAPKAE